MKGVLRFVPAFAPLFALLFLNPLSSGEKNRKDDGKSDDATFVLKASEAGIAEVAAGQLAVKRAGSSAVRKFGMKMVEDHTQANEELIALAKNNGFKPAKQMNDQHIELVNKLSKLQGAEFDREYMPSQVKDHVEAVALFRKHAKNAQNADLKAFAAKTLPHLQMHLKMAKDIAGKSSRD